MRVQVVVVVMVVVEVLLMLLLMLVKASQLRAGVADEGGVPPGGRCARRKKTAAASSPGKEKSKCCSTGTYTSRPQSILRPTLYCTWNMDLNCKTLFLVQATFFFRDSLATHSERLRDNFGNHHPLLKNN